MIRVLIVLLVLAISLSCDKKTDKVIVDSSSVVDYKIIESTYSDDEKAIEELDRKAVIDLYKNGIERNSKHKIEFFFICSSAENAKKLNKYLELMGYTAAYRQIQDKKDFAVIGYTMPVSINEEAVVGWAKDMSKIAEKNSSVFDGWQIAVK
ncbi:ribonuclease E inhibitor RraB [Chryseobacterium sp. UNC8MFCol]|uniref:ribonuclease E inhibitor RraB n=1 Tax=Chryseobacterium sp. UNC8MFCol TaxID=1340435 RepID=UPI000489747B|nr:ribonuclease E inhibitor RraB [Chryseobacterium sp. UNC8MFCol]